MGRTHRQSQRFSRGGQRVASRAFGVGGGASERTEEITADDDRAPGGVVVKSRRLRYRPGRRIAANYLAKCIQEILCESSAPCSVGNWRQHALRILVVGAPVEFSA